MGIDRLKETGNERRGLQFVTVKGVSVSERGGDKTVSQFCATVSGERRGPDYPGCGDEGNKGADDQLLKKQRFPKQPRLWACSGYCLLHC